MSGSTDGLIAVFDTSSSLDEEDGFQVPYTLLLMQPLTRLRNVNC